MTDLYEIEQARADYDRDGAVVLRGVLSEDWVSRIAGATDRLMQRGSGTDINRPGEGRFFAGFFAWLQDPEFEALVRESPLAALAGQIMNAAEVRFFYDQLLVKEPGTVKRTPWHQDLPYWPVMGNDILSIWVPMDPAGADNGVVTYVRGSHRWNAFFPQDSWNEGVGGKGEVGGENDVRAPNGASLADIRDNPEKYEFISWEVEPGDVIVHHPLTVHGAPGNTSQGRRRRAVATRWFGDDAYWDGSRDNFMDRQRRIQADFPYPDLSTGDRPVAPIFPLVWQKTSGSTA